MAGRSIKSWITTIITIIRSSVSVDDRSETHKKANRGINSRNIMDQILILVEFHANTIASTIISGDVGEMSSWKFTISLRDNEINQYKWEHIVDDDRDLYYHGSRGNLYVAFIFDARRLSHFFFFLLSILHLWCLEVTLSILLTLDFCCHWTLRVRPLLPGKRLTISLLPVNKWQYIWYT